MNVFTDSERAYLRDAPRLGRLATVGRDGTPHVAPVGWSYNSTAQTIDIGGFELERTKKYRDVARSGRAALVIDELISTDPWQVRGIELRGRAEALPPPRALIRLYPERIVSWGLRDAGTGRREARSIPRMTM